MGFITESNVPDVVLLSLSNLLIISVSLLCFINIAIYFLILFYSDALNIKNFLSNKIFLTKLVNFYKSLSERIIFVFYEIILFSLKESDY